ncbi:hypothetical protein IMZ48_26725 [Candidatus Bathyarchaeota archaeon]|nr:hypothetical protein [Candidatus Bathyarchaeota archaeon]
MPEFEILPNITTDKSKSKGPSKKSSTKGRKTHQRAKSQGVSEEIHR